MCAFFDEYGNLKNTYLSKGSTGGCNNYMIGLSRIMSLATRKGATIDEIIDQLDSCGVCPSYAIRKATKKDTSPGSCCPMAVGRALREMHNEVLGRVCEMEDEVQYDCTPKCPKCGAELLHEGGCIICKNCGYSKCD